MSCRDISKKLTGYVVGELAGGDAQAVREHVQSCGECRSELKRLASVWSGLEGMPAGRPASVAPRVIARIDAHESGLSGRFRLWLGSLAPSFAGAAAAVMLLGLVSGALLSSIYYPDTGQDQPDPDAPAYSEALSDAPPESFFEMYLLAAGQNGKENSL